jgi:urease accessory protein
MLTTITVITTMIMGTDDPTPRDGFLKLLVWLSPSFPIGAFSYSHGIEWAVEAGDIMDRASLEAWLAGIMLHGTGLADAIILRHAHTMTIARDGPGLAAVAELASAFQPSRERALESYNQGRAFLDTVVAAWPAPGVEYFRTVWDGVVAYPLAVGVAAAGHEIDANQTCLAYLHAFLANLVSAAVRLVPLGQTDGQRVVAAMADVVRRIAQRSDTMSLDDLGGCALRSDIASMRHETQYTRLFRS